MAVFRIEATPADGLTAYAFWIHGSIKVEMKDGVGSVEVDWLTCKSGNFVDYTLEGPAGACLGFRILCDDGEVHASKRTKSSSEPERYSESFSN